MSYHSTGNRRSWNGRGLGKVRGGEGRWKSSVCTCIYWTDAIPLGSYIVSIIIVTLLPERGRDRGGGADVQCIRIACVGCVMSRWFL